MSRQRHHVQRPQRLKCAFPDHKMSKKDFVVEANYAWEKKSRTLSHGIVQSQLM